MTDFFSNVRNAFRGHGASPSRWKVLCLMYQHIDVEYRAPLGSGSFSHSLSPDEISIAEWSLGHFPALAQECSCGLVDISYDVEHVSRPITSLTHMGRNRYWPSPSDVRPELKKLASSYDSVFVLWPQNKGEGREQIPSGGWGLAIGPGHIPGGGTYCSIANASSCCWSIPIVGEVWLHEWLHGICDLYECKGYRMPVCNADGGGSHGYVQSPVTGWCRYYRDLMTGRVLEDGCMTGIPPQAWLSGTIRK